MLEIFHWHFIFWVFVIVVMLFLEYIMQLHVYVFLDIDLFQYWRRDWGFILRCQCDSFWRDYQRFHSQSLRQVSCFTQCKVTVLRIPCSVFSNQLYCSILFTFKDGWRKAIPEWLWWISEYPREWPQIWRHSILLKHSCTSVVRWVTGNFLYILMRFVFLRVYVITGCLSLNSANATVI